MAEKAENPIENPPIEKTIETIEKKSQEPVSEPTTERVEKQTTEVDETTFGAGDFTKGTVTPDLKK